jgi:hypothetical protein
MKVGNWLCSHEFLLGHSVDTISLGLAFVEKTVTSADEEDGSSPRHTHTPCLGTPI